MNKLSISLKKLHGVVVFSNANTSGEKKQVPYTINAEMMRLGFIMSSKLMDSIVSLPTVDQKELGTEIIKALKHLKGDDVKYKPMYPNFPKQVMEMSHLELYLNAITHYWSYGQWKPNYDELPREYAFENTKFREITLLNENDFSDLFTTLLSSNDSLSEEDKEIVEWFLDTQSILRYPDEIPYKETLCIITGRALKEGKEISGLIKTSTDILRLVTYINGGDISLAENTKFKSLPRSYRRKIVAELERVISEEDIQRHRNKWCKLFHNLHVGEYSKKVLDIATKVRSNSHLYNTKGEVQTQVNKKNFLKASKLLKNRPGEFARSLDSLLRKSGIDESIIKDDFLRVSSDVSTRVLMQLKGHFNARNNGMERVVFPKGNMARAQIIPSFNTQIPDETLIDLMIGIDKTLEDRFANMDSLGKVYIDPRLKGCPLPAQQRSSSTGLDIVARGTRLPFGDDATLRLFIYWVGRDIDLSATLHDENFNQIGHISYTKLKSAKYQAYHSGDITNAPNGASEFIDITIDDAHKSGARYVVMNVYVYNGPNFADHDKCYAGWMTRNAPNSNEIYDPKTVISKVDITSASRNAIPVVFDLKTREAVWCDLTTKGRSHWGGNNIESNKASTEQILRAITSLDNKPTIYDLITLHGKSRGMIVDTPKEADVIFGIDEGITPRDINVINSEYLS